MTYLHERRDKWGKSSEDVGDELLAKRGISKYAFIAGVGEGTVPTGLEMHSGYILTPDDKIWAFMTGWDPEKVNPDGGNGYYTLRYLRETADPEYWKNSPNYFRVRRELGLPLTEEQERILREFGK